MKPGLIKDLDQFYQDMIEPIELFGTCLAEGDIQSCKFVVIQFLSSDRFCHKWTKLLKKVIN